MLTKSEIVRHLCRRYSITLMSTSVVILQDIVNSIPDSAKESVDSLNAYLVAEEKGAH